MTTATSVRVPPRRPVRPMPAARPGRDLALGVAPLAAVSAATCWVLGLPTSHLLDSVVLYALFAGLVLLNFPGLSRGPGIGPANRVTTLRATLVVPVAALMLHPDVLDERAAWWIITLSAAALLLDGVDGRVARRTGSASAFGARFDMELDAALLLSLSVLVWQSGRVGPWVLAIGGIRYAFVLAASVWPVLGGQLPRSGRRKAVCAVQGVALLVALGPTVPAEVAVRAAALALALLVWSFAVDVGWLVRSAPRGRAGAL